MRKTLLLLLSFNFILAQYFPVMIDQKFWGTSDEDYPTKLIVGTDNKLYACGYSETGGNLTGIIVKINPKTMEAEWMKLFPGVNGAMILDLANSGKGNILFAGTSIDKSYNYQYLFGEIDTTGKILWQKIFGGQNTDIAFCIEKTKFKGSFISGNSWSNDIIVGTPKNNNALCLLTNEDGNIIRKFNLGGSGNDWATAVKQTSDGGFIMIINSNSGDGIVNDKKGKFYTNIIVVKMDFAGNIQWKKNISLPFEDIAYDVIETSGGSFVVVGYTYLPEKNKDYFFLKLNKFGKIVVEKNFGTPAVEELKSVIATNDGGFVCVGTSYARKLIDESFKGKADVRAFRTNSVGSIIWEKSFGGPHSEKGVAVAKIDKHTFIILAEKENHFNPDKTSYKKDFWLVKVKEKECKEIKPKFEIYADNNREVVGTPIKFINKSEYGDKFIWDFGDGTTSTEKNPVKKYQKPGVYLLRLTVKANKTCSVTYIYPKALVITEY